MPLPVLRLSCPTCSHVLRSRMPLPPSRASPKARGRPCLPSARPPAHPLHTAHRIAAPRLPSRDRDTAMRDRQHPLHPAHRRGAAGRHEGRAGAGTLQVRRGLGMQGMQGPSLTPHAAHAPCLGIASPAYRTRPAGPPPSTPLSHVTCSRSRCCGQVPASAPASSLPRPARHHPDSPPRPARLRAPRRCAGKSRCKPLPEASMRRGVAAGQRIWRTTRVLRRRRIPSRLGCGCG